MKNIYLFFFQFCFFNQIIAESKKDENFKKIKKRKLDISFLREQFVHEMISLLELFENTFSKVFFDKEFSDESKKKILNYFSWARISIVSFENDPFSYDRTKLEEGLLKVDECKIYLKKFLEKEKSNGRV